MNAFKIGQLCAYVRSIEDLPDYISRALDALEAQYDFDNIETPKVSKPVKILMPEQSDKPKRGRPPWSNERRAEMSARMKKHHAKNYISSDVKTEVTKGQGYTNTRLTG